MNRTCTRMKIKIIINNIYWRKKTSTLTCTYMNYTEHEYLITILGYINNSFVIDTGSHIYFLYRKLNVN